MATVKPAPSRTPSRPRRWRRLALIVGLALLVGLAMIWPSLHAQARAGAAVGARVACACRYVAGRSLADCAKDFEPGMGMIMLSEDAGAHSITARVPLVASETAQLRDGAGCQLEPWRE